MMPLRLPMLCAFLLLATAAAGEGEVRQLPTEIDLRAAYCLPIALDNYRDAEEASRLNVVSDNPEIKAMHQKTFAVLAERLRRLQQYVVPRVPYLKMEGMLLAQQRGKTDNATLKVLSETCQTTCTQRRDSASVVDPACVQDCLAADPVWARITVCHDMPWLPF